MKWGSKTRDTAAEGKTKMAINGDRSKGVEANRETDDAALGKKEKEKKIKDQKIR